MGFLTFTAFFIITIFWQQVDCATTASTAHTLSSTTDHNTSSKGLRCPANSQLGMVSDCDETCDTMLFDFKCSGERVEGCICTQGQYAQSGTFGESVVCVTSDKCEAKCGPNMHYEKEASGCQATCDHRHHKICLKPHSRKCVCDAGYILDHKHEEKCVKEDEC
ncbi:mucin-5B-like [Pseudophryne corroboree]|uniref:mucin-5B-like n=1 Tax=Pseudophryne corroboree TaxID=495146 RepID=UPI0030813554